MSYRRMIVNSRWIMRGNISHVTKLHIKRICDKTAVYLSQTNSFPFIVSRICIPASFLHVLAAHLMHVNWTSCQHMRRKTGYVSTRNTDIVPCRWTERYSRIGTDMFLACFMEVVTFWERYCLWFSPLQPPPGLNFPSRLVVRPPLNAHTHTHTHTHTHCGLLLLFFPVPPHSCSV